MWTTENCCLCFGLRMGCIIVGWIQLVFPAIAIIIDIIAKIKGHTMDANPIIDAIGNSKGFWGDVIANGVQIFLACCLLYGIYAHHKKLIHYYLYVETLIVGVRVIIVVINLFSHAYTNVPVALGVSVFTWVILIYWLIVVYSYYKEMADHD